MLEQTERARLTRSSTTSPLRAVGLAAAIVLVAINLRPSIVAIGPLTKAIQTDTGLSFTATGLLTTVPLICLGEFAVAAPPLARRAGFERGVLVAVALIVAGIALRLLTPVAALFAGTVVVGGGIALANVLVPAMIKRDFARRVGAMMAIYSTALQSGATVAAAVTVPLGSAVGGGWRVALALWGLPAAAAVVVWIPYTVRTRAATAGSHGPRYRVWRSGLGWASAGFIGFQSAVYFSITSWLPSLLHDAGMSDERAGVMLSLVGLAGILGGLPMPLLATRLRSQRSLVIGVVAAFLVGLVGLLLDPVPLAPVWAIAFGIGQGGALSLALTLFTLRSRTADGAAQLSGMAQAGGYLIAAVGPLAVGSIHGLVDGWTVPLIVLIVTLVPLTGTGWVIARPRFLEDEAHTPPAAAGDRAPTTPAGPRP